MNYMKQSSDFVSKQKTAAGAKGDIKRQKKSAIPPIPVLAETQIARGASDEKAAPHAAGRLSFVFYSS